MIIIKDLENKGKEEGFSHIESRIDGVAMRKGSIMVIISLSKELDNKAWLHLSMSRPNKYIPYEEMKWIKNVFLGENSKAIQVLAPMDKHVNIHNYCLHLWYCIDGDSLPDFTRGTKSI